jgi:hypothetical protein
MHYELIIERKEGESFLGIFGVVAKSYSDHLSISFKGYSFYVNYLTNNDFRFVFKVDFNNEELLIYTDNYSIRLDFNNGLSFAIGKIFSLSIIKNH